MLLINQIRDNIGGNPYQTMTSPGGWGLKHSGSLRMQTFNPQETWENAKTRDNLLGINFRYYVCKTSVTTFIAAMQEVYMSRDPETDTCEIDPVLEIVDLAKKLEIFTSSSGDAWAGRGNAYFPLSGASPLLSADDNGILPGNGEKNIKAFLRENPHTLELIEAEVDKRIASGFMPPLSDDLLETDTALSE